VQFERRGWSSEYWTGQVIQQFNDFDPVVGHTVSEEVALQLDAMVGLGVNTVTLELRTADQDGNLPFLPAISIQSLGFNGRNPRLRNLLTSLLLSI